MNQKQFEARDGHGSTDAEQVDPFTTGDAMLARAKSVSQRIADRVRELTQDTRGHAVPDEDTGGHEPLSE